MSTKNPHVLKRIAIAFAVAVAATGVYVYFLDAHTMEARQRTQLESTQTQLIKAKVELQNKSATSAKEAQQQLQQINDLNKQLKDTQDQLQAKRASNTALAQAVPAQAAYKATGTKDDWLRASGIPQSLWGYVDYIVTRESGWNPNAVNHNGGACGLGQQLPCGKWAGAWNDPVAALIAMNGYVAKYGGWAGAVAFWQSHNWY